MHMNQMRLELRTPDIRLRCNKLLKLSCTWRRLLNFTEIIEVVEILIWAWWPNCTMLEELATECLVDVALFSWPTSSLRLGFSDRPGAVHFTNDMPFMESWNENY